MRAYTTYKKRINRIHRRNRGSVIVMVACGMVAVLGFAAFATDYGVLVNDTNRIQRGCDAAALAGATMLGVSGAVATDQYNARNLALVTAARNGITVNSGDITFPSDNKIKVPSTTTRQFFFARVLGINNGTVTRSASAGRVGLRGIPRAVPLAITVDDYINHKNGASFELQLIRNQDTDFVNGTVSSLDLRPDSSGKSGNVFQTDLTDGYFGTVFLDAKIDNALTSDVGSQGAKLENAMQQRFADALAAPYADTGRNYTWPNYPPQDRRIITIIVADPNPAANNNPLLVARYFVSVYVESMRSPGNKVDYIRMRILPSQTFDSQSPNLALGDENTPLTGPSAITLLQ